MSRKWLRFNDALSHSVQHNKIESSNRSVYRRTYELVGRRSRTGDILSNNGKFVGRYKADEGEAD